MDAIRCLDCGDVRWSLIGLKGEPGTCALCDGEMVPERRRPAAARPRFAPPERRFEAPAASAADEATVAFRPTA